MDEMSKLQQENDRLRAIIWGAIDEIGRSYTAAEAESIGADIKQRAWLATEGGKDGVIAVDAIETLALWALEQLPPLAIIGACDRALAWVRENKKNSAE